MPMELDPELLKALQGFPEPRDYLEVFTERDFKGSSQKFPAGGRSGASYDMGDLAAPNGVGNDTISSIKVPTTGDMGCRVTLYAEAGFKGASKEFRGDAAYVGDDINNKTSSIRILKMVE